MIPIPQIPTEIIGNDSPLSESSVSDKTIQSKGFGTDLFYRLNDFIIGPSIKPVQ